MKVIVITGSTRGIGYGLADSFLARGCSVVVSGRTQVSTDEALKKLVDKYGLENVYGCSCDVSEHDQVQSLWDAAREHFGKVHIWINNAGMANPMGEVWSLSPQTVEDVVGTNMLGTIYGSMVALSGMIQQGLGELYSMEGMGSDGRKHEGLNIYGTTKYGLHYFTEALVEEARGTPVIVGSISPGMVATDLLKEQYEGKPEEWEQAKSFLSILVDRVETVAPWIVDQILANDKTGDRIQWLTRRKFFGRMLTSRFKERDVFE